MTHSPKAATELEADPTDSAQPKRRMTRAEGLLWVEIRNRQVESCKFRRQYEVESLVLDFYCPNLKLAIVVEGSEPTSANQHPSAQQVAAAGITLLKFSPQAIYEGLPQVVESIAQTIRQLRTNREEV
jgi:very-short-patch-repair endonuclease